METNADRKLTRKQKYGYAIGETGEAIGFNVFYFFFLFFLTDYAGISPALAGTVSLISLIWDAATDPFMGYISDNINTKWGRRRPFMIIIAIPYAVMLFLLFHDVDMNSNDKGIYFIVIAILFWTAYKFFTIPYFALGAELTDNFDERTSLRSWSGLFVYMSVMAASAAPPLIISYSEKHGGTSLDGWDNVGMIFGAIAAISIIICWAATKNGEVYSKEDYSRYFDKNKKRENPIKTYLEIAKLKPVKYLAASIFAGSAISSFVSSGPVYLMTNNLGYSPERQSLYFTILSLMQIFWIPILNYSAKKFDKKQVYAVGLLLGAVTMAVFTLIGFGNFKLLLLYTFLYTAGNSAFWTLYYSMMYDISELDELVNSKRREGSISSFMSFAQKCGAAFAMWVMGLCLQFSHYDGLLTVQPESASNMILYINTIIPAVLGFLAVFVVWRYPLNRKGFAKVLTAVELKRQGKEYSKEGLERII